MCGNLIYVATCHIDKTFVVRLWDRIEDFGEGTSYIFISLLTFFFFFLPLPQPIQFIIGQSLELQKTTTYF